MTDEPEVDGELRQLVAEQAVQLGQALDRLDSLLPPDLPASATSELETVRQHTEALKASVRPRVVEMGGVVDEAAAAVAGVTTSTPLPLEEQP